MDRHSRIYVAGAETLIGAALLRRLRAEGYSRLVGIQRPACDLTRADDVQHFFRTESPEFVFLTAGKSGGIRANQMSPADLMLDNLLVQTHVIDAAHRHRVRKLLYLASSCSYPRHSPQPMSVESLLTGALEPTNEAYAVAKLAGIRLCQAYVQQHGAAFISGIPANAFGQEDDFSPESGHVIPALIARLHEAKLQSRPSVEIWGTGTPRREFIYADDLADACIFVMRHYRDAGTPLNLGGGEDLSIRETAEAVRSVVGYAGELRFDASRPDGMPLKSLDSRPLRELGWRPRTPFRKALAETYQAYLRQTLKGAARAS